MRHRRFGLSGSYLFMAKRADLWSGILFRREPRGNTSDRHGKSK
jgi:hypothetical protein